MSVSRKVLKNMKKVMGVIGAIPVLASCSSQISRAEVNVGFDPCNKVLYFSGKDGVIDSTWKERYNSDSIRRVVIDDGIRKVGTDAFGRCKSLEKIIITSPITEVGEKAFWRCESLQEINIPNSVTNIGSGAFSGCKSLKEVTIPNSVTNIGSDAFSGCKSLKEVTIPNSVNIIDKFAFCACESLREITIPNSVQFIYEFAFASSGLETVKFEDMSRCDSKSCLAVWLRKNAFYGCKQLRILDLGTANMSRMAKVEEGAFRECDQNFRALEGREVRGKFYNTVLNYHYNYFIPHAFLVDKTKYWER